MTGRFDSSLLPLSPDLSFETALWAAGARIVAGIDEAGRGSLAGPVAAAALILDPDPSLEHTLFGVRDSKELSPESRAEWSLRLKEVAAAWGIGFASHTEIDTLGIVPATRMAAYRALASLPEVPDHLLIDYIFLPDSPLPQTALIKGDCRSLTIAAASILAKTARDDLLREMESLHPGYGFAEHKGYCTPGHLKAIQRLGPCPIHRSSFSPFRNGGGF